MYYENVSNCNIRMNDFSDWFLYNYILWWYEGGTPLAIFSFGSLNSQINENSEKNRHFEGHGRSESTKQMEQTLRAKFKIFFKSENLKKGFNEKWWAYRVYIRQKKVGVAVIIYF